MPVRHTSLLLTTTDGALAVGIKREQGSENHRHQEKKKEQYDGIPPHTLLLLRRGGFLGLRRNSLLIIDDDLLLLVEIPLDFRHVEGQSLIVPHADGIEQKCAVLLRVSGLETLEILIGDHEPRNIVQIHLLRPHLRRNNAVNLDGLNLDLPEFGPRTATT